MDFTPDPQDDAFRLDVRAFVMSHLPPDLARRGRRDYHSRRADVRRWMRILNRKGWSAPHWPAAYGGQPWTPLQLAIFREELRRARAPVHDRVGVDMLGPTLCVFGSEEQKRRYLPPILNGDEWWCQGFSEPGAGSDLASLRTRAESRGDHYLVNGHKIWTTEAHVADWMFALVRTDPEARPQEGISFLLIRMDSPGLEVRPIWTIDESLTLNEVFLKDVRVPVENRVGEEGKGWTYAKQLLGFERTTNAEVPHSKRDLMQLKHLAATVRRDGRPLAEDPRFAGRIAELEIALTALEWAVLRVLHASRDDASVGAVASVLKLRGSELYQQVAELCADALGGLGVAMSPEPEGEHILRPDGLSPPLADDEAVGVPPRALFRRAASIYAGANEVQRNIIAKTILRM